MARVRPTRDSSLARRSALALTALLSPLLAVPLGAGTALAQEAAPPPANDARAAASAVGALPVAVEQSTQGATTEVDELLPCDIGSTVWFTWTATDDVKVSLSTMGSSFDTVIAVYAPDSPGYDGTQLACNDEADNTSQSRLEVDVTAGNTYLIQAGGWRGDVGELRLAISEAPAVQPAAHDDQAAAAQVSVPSTHEQSTVGATLEQGESTLCGGAPTTLGATVWLRLTPDADSTVTASTARSNFDTIMAAFPGTAAHGEGQLACNDDFGGPGVRTSEISFPVTAGNAYLIQVGGYHAQTGNLVVDLSSSTTSGPSPNLTVSSLTEPPATLHRGGYVELEDTTSNPGLGGAESTRTGYWLSADASFGDGDVSLGSRAVPALAPGASSTLEAFGYVGTTVPLGLYRVLACADDLHQAVEADETDNCRASTGTVEVREAVADLGVFEIGAPPATVQRGATFDVEDLTGNAGGGTAPATTTRFLLAVHPGRTTSDVLLGGSHAVPTLTSNQTHRASTTVTVPLTTPTGSYYLLGCSDFAEVVTEASEVNNCSSWHDSTVQVTAPNSPDLTTRSLTNPPSSSTQGGTFPATSTTHNDGTASAAATTTRFYLSADGAKGSGDRLLSGTHSVPALAAGGSSAATRTLTVPASTAPGSYYLLACADDTSLVVEGNEVDNCSHSEHTVAVAGVPDLGVSAVTNAASAVRGGVLSVTDTTRNSGGAAAPLSSTRYYLSTDAVRGTGDRLLSGAHSVPALAAGGTHAATRSVTVPSTVAPASYYLLACADDARTVAESLETNNCRPSATRVSVTAPDLVVTAVNNPPASIVRGTAFSATDTTRNTGTGAAVPSSTRYYLSADQVRGTGDRLLSGVHGVPTLGAGISHRLNVTATVPVTVPAGTYYLLACADYAATVPETSETNNCRASTGRVVVTAPDLVVSSLTSPPMLLRAGASLSLTETTLNRGAAPAAASSTRYLLSLDTTRSTADRLLTGAHAVPVLSGSGKHTATTSVTVPTATPGGSYYVLACSDYGRAVKESSERNNCRASSSRVIVLSPDLAVSALSNPPSTRKAGTAFSIEETTLNRGNTVAGASSTRYLLSLDTTRGSTDRLLSGSHAVPQLAPAGKHAATLNATVPSTTPAGSYYVLACSDYARVVAEAIETNNCRRSSTRISITR